MSENKQVTLAYPYEHGGTNYKADSTVWLPTAVANDLLFFGRARLPESAPKSPAAKKATAKPATTATVKKES